MPLRHESEVMPGRLPNEVTLVEIPVHIEHRPGEPTAIAIATSYHYPLGGLGLFLAVTKSIRPGSIIATYWGPTNDEAITFAEAVQRWAQPNTLWMAIMRVQLDMQTKDSRK